MSLQGHKSDRAQTAVPGNSGDIKRGALGRMSAAAGNSSNPRLRSLMASAPDRATVMLILLGMVVGLMTAYVLIPTEFTGASPRHLSQQAIHQWVRMVAVGHSEDIHYDDANALIVLRQIPNPQDVVQGLSSSVEIPAAERAALEALTDIPGFADLPGAVAPQDPGIIVSSLQVLLALAVVAIGVPLLVIAGRAIYPARSLRSIGQAACKSSDVLEPGAGAAHFESGGAAISVVCRSATCGDLGRR